MRIIQHRTIFAGLLIGLLVALGPLSPAARGEAPPEGVQILLPRNAIASIDEPRFVPADEADLPDDAWILGYARDGEARAYSLNLLNRHEIVNDRIGSHPIAAVW